MNLFENLQKLNEQDKFIDVLIDKLKKDINKGMLYYESNDIYYGLPGHNRM